VKVNKHSERADFYVIFGKNINKKKKQRRIELFGINDTVVYGTEGICVIVDITEKIFDSNTQQYYVLRPVYNKSSLIMVPT
jgi:hypothetical protein